MKVKLGICIPSTGEWKADFGVSVARLCSYISGTSFFDGFERDAHFIDKRTSNLPRSRQESLEDAIMNDCTHALMIDADQSFPHDTAHRLVRHQKPIVACNIPLKVHPSYPTARAKSHTSPFGSPIYSNAPIGKPPPTGLERVWRVGAGVMLVDLSILQSVPKPWFEIRWSDKHQQFVGEDWYFLDRLEKHGHGEFYIDHDLSRLVEHVGNFSWSHAHIPVVDLEQRAAA